ncbi:hypothetical protein GIB67_022145 [Kingdonia uniflora]|uniref:Glycosyl hydrolase family 32 N-terminal domain-containing protein n=1 Tax=Kingdonia uniflora TaxID=39325 RepID=A0A7J7N9A6_9MAGN|nr:hypothetical protein GIB67_022145 [Kingdonia uniflora]
MRLDHANPDNAQFTDYLMEIGSNPENTIQLPSTIQNCAIVQDLILSVYSNLNISCEREQGFLTERTILSVRNNDVSSINDEALSLFLRESIVYLAVDKIEEAESADRTYNDRYPTFARFTRFVSSRAKISTVEKNVEYGTDSRFTQQELPACKPILTPQWVILGFTLISVIFIPISVASLLASQNVVEIVYRYETDCIPIDSKGDKVPKRMKHPIYVYYQLDNFYQNHHRIESKGKGIYQPHHLFEDIKEISENDRKRLTVFGDIIRSTQVRSSGLFDINGCWYGSVTIPPGDKPVMLYTGVSTQNRQVQNLATPKNLSNLKIVTYVLEHFSQL